jgi:hypothetical protein
MLNNDLKKLAVTRLENAHAHYIKQTGLVNELSSDLLILRQSSSETVIGAVQEYINSLANTPKEFDKTFSEFRAEYRIFKDIIDEIQNESMNAELSAGGSAATGMLAGVGVASFAPTAAMAIATTFGTASTGTAISTLSGAAATNAALAWLGGGALTAGGGGMVAGEALLALAGPIGWTIGGAALVGSALFLSSKNKNIADQANRQRKEIEANSRQLETALIEMDRLYSLTTEHVNGMNNLMAALKTQAPSDYRQFTAEHKNKIGSLINHVHSLSVLLNKKVDV